MRLGNAVALAVAGAAERDGRVFVVDGDLADSYGVDQVVSRLGDRYVQAGIGEQAMVSLAAGLASCGKRPWVFSFAAFLCCRAYDQIRVCISQTGLPVVLVGSHAGGGAGKNGKTHSITNDFALMCTLPGIDIWAPVDASEAGAIVPRIIATDRPAYIRLPRDPQVTLHGLTEDCSSFGAPGIAALVATGVATHWALRVQSQLARLAIEIPVIHVSRLEPFPVERVANAIAGCRLLLVIEDHNEVGGLSDIVRRLFPDRRLRAFGWPRAWPGASGEIDELRAAAGLGDKALVRACVEAIESLGISTGGID